MSLPSSGLWLPTPESHHGLLFPQGELAENSTPKQTHTTPYHLCPPLLYPLSKVPLASHPTPQREKKRVLFFYNEFLRKRSAFSKLRRAAIIRQARQQRAPVSTVPSKPISSPQGLKTLRRRDILFGIPSTLSVPGPPELSGSGRYRVGQGCVCL